MGNTLATMQTDLAGTDSREILDRLEDMAQDRIDLFYDKIGHDEIDKHLIPIKKVLNKYTYIGVEQSTKPVIWKNEVQEAVEEFTIGPVAEGLSSVATRVITKMLSSAAGRRQVEQKYAISLDRLGGISRLDYFIFTYNFASTELQSKKTSLVACCVVESSADVSEIDPNTLRVIISRAFRGGDIRHSTLNAIYAQLITAIKMSATGSEFSSLSVEDKEDLESWYNRQVVNQKMVQPNGGVFSYKQSSADGDDRGDTVTPTEEAFTQGGFKPMGAAA